MRFKKEKLMLEREREAILERMSEMDPTDDMYEKMMDKLQYLANLERKNKKSVSPDTIALIAANLTGIIIVLTWEEKHVIATKTFGMISKLRL